MSNYILKKIIQQQETVEGKPINLDGEEIRIGALNEEEKKQMIKEGFELGNKTVELDGVETKLIDIKNGEQLFTILEVKNYEDVNFTGLWYIWRARVIMREFNKLSDKAQEQLRAILKTKNLDVYLEAI